MIINDLGKKILLHYPDTVVIPDNSFEDPVREGQFRKPDYKADNAPVITENTEIIVATVQHAPKDFIDFGGTSDPRNILRLKTYLTDVPKLMRAEYIIPNYDSKDTIYTKFKLLREPVPRGLQIDRYALSYWERM